MIFCATCGRQVLIHAGQLYREYKGRYFCAGHMPECVGCDERDNLRRMNLEQWEDTDGPAWICPRCDDDSDGMVAEFLSTGE